MRVGLFAILLTTILTGISLTFAHRGALEEAAQQDAIPGPLSAR